MAIIRIYLSEQPPPNRGRFEIYRDGKPTGEMATITTIRKMLTNAQYKQFTMGEDIFLVKGEVFRARNYKEQVVKNSRTHNNLKKKKNGKIDT